MKRLIIFFLTFQVINVLAVVKKNPVRAAVLPKKVITAPKKAVPGNPISNPKKPYPIVNKPIPNKWTQVSRKQAEWNRLSLEYSRICEYFNANFGPNWNDESTLGSPRCTYVFQYLKSVGTPTSLRFLKHLIAKKEMPACFLHSI